MGSIDENTPFRVDPQKELLKFDLSLNIIKRYEGVMVEELLTRREDREEIYNDQLSKMRDLEKELMTENTFTPEITQSK